MKTIVLVGMPGSGKSTAGQILAKILKAEFYDLDALIEEDENMKISEIFKSYGEKYFRECEINILDSVFKYDNQVISTGGGAFETDLIRNFLLKNSFVFYLKTSPEELYFRIKDNKDRPLFKDGFTIKNVRQILNIREKNYKLAHYTIITDNKSPDEIAEEISIKCVKLK